MGEPLTFDTSNCAGGTYHHCSSKTIVHDSYIETYTRQGYFTYHFNDFDDVIFIPACFTCAYTYIIFVDSTNESNPNCNDNYFSPETLDHKHKIWLCSGIFGFKKSIAPGKQMFDEIKKRFDLFKKEGQNATFAFNKNESKFYNDFKNRFGVDFDDFRSQLTFLTGRTRGVSKLLFQDGPSTLGNLRTIYSIAYSDAFFIMIPDGTIDGVIPLIDGFSKQDFAVALTKESVDEEFVDCIKNCEKDVNNIFEMIIPMDSILFIEPFENVSTLKTHASSPSSVNLMVTEAMFGTAAAVNKANKANETVSFDWSGFKVCFEPSISRELYFDGDTVRNSSKLQGLIRSKSKDAYDRKEMAKMIGDAQRSSVSVADEIRKFKELLDDGIITQEEFDKKKKELLGF